MMTFLVVYGGIALISGIVVMLDRLAQRHDRRTGHRS